MKLPSGKRFDITFVFMYIALKIPLGVSSTKHTRNYFHAPKLKCRIHRFVN